MSNERRTVVVTGAGSGIGKAIAAAFHGAGDRVFVSDLSESRVRASADEIGLTDYAAVDVEERGDVDRMISDAFEKTGRLDVVINSAGIFDGYAGVQETTPQLWDKVIGVNLNGAYNVARAGSLVMLREETPGVVLCVSSIGGERASLDGLSYVTSKAAVNHMVRRMAFELGRKGIRVNAVCPGSISTDIRATSGEILGGLVDMDRGMGVSLTSEVVDFMLPAGRSGDSEEVASVALFLASSAANYINGQAINVDGGWTAG